MRPGDRVLAEEREWDVITDDLIPQGTLISVSGLVGDSRVYRTADWIVKIRRLGAAGQAGVQPLEREARILRRIGRRAEAGTTGDWEHLRTPYIAGRQLSDGQGRGMSRAALIVATAFEVLQLNRHGIAHGDVRADNVMVDESGEVVLVDFDRARLTSPDRAFLRDWISATPFAGGSSVPEMALDVAFPLARSIARRTRARFRTPTPQVRGDRVTVGLDRAWWIAAKSNSNAPGHRIAYYSWTFNRNHYLGERPWAFRWDLLRRAVSFEGKRVLELGSNMAMASAHALLHGASEATAVDSDELILDAAALLGVALGVPIRTVRMKFGADTAWEDALPQADLAIAMSILEWVPDRGRFERYLGRFAEVVFEGHETAAIERERLTRIGFRHVTLVGESERRRPLFVARR